jgi:hypothetical protein
MGTMTTTSTCSSTLLSCSVLTIATARPLLLSCSAVAMATEGPTINHRSLVDYSLRPSLIPSLSLRFPHLSLSLTLSLSFSLPFLLSPCRSELEEFGISSFVYRARRPFHPVRLMTFVTDKLGTEEDDDEEGETEGEEGVDKIEAKAGACGDVTFRRSPRC